MILLELKSKIESLRADVMFGQGDKDGSECSTCPPMADAQLAMALAHLQLAANHVQMADYYRMRKD